MLYIELTPLPNGAHNNQRTSDPFPVPEGWAVVPPELEEEAWGYLPFIDLTVEDGQIVAVAKGVVPDPEPVPEPEPTEAERLRADLDYLAALQGITL